MRLSTIFAQKPQSVNDAVMDAQKHGFIDIEPTTPARDTVLFFGKAKDTPFVLVSLAKMDATVAEAQKEKAAK